MITPYILKQLIFLYAGIGSVLSISHYSSLGIAVGYREGESGFGTSLLLL